MFLQEFNLQFQNKIFQLLYSSSLECLNNICTIVHTLSIKTIYSKTICRNAWRPVIKNGNGIYWKLFNHCLKVWYLPVKTSKIPKLLKSSFRSCCFTSSIEQLPSKSKVSNTFSTYWSLLNDDADLMPCRFFFFGVTLKLWQTFSNITRLPKVWLWARCWASFCSIHDDKGSWQASLEMTNYLYVAHKYAMLFTIYLSAKWLFRGIVAISWTDFDKGKFCILW